MGAKHYGALSDYLFYCLVERELLNEDGSCGLLELLLWCRFRDDILCILSSQRSSGKLFKQVCDSAKPCYTLKREDFSFVGVHMLDLFVSSQKMLTSLGG